MGILDYIDKTINDIKIGDKFPREKRNFSNSEILAIENFYTNFNKKFGDCFEIINSKREIIENYNVVSRRKWNRFNYYYSEEGEGLPSRGTATESFIKSFYYKNKLIQFSFTKHWLNKLDSSVFPRLLRLFRAEEVLKYTKPNDKHEYDFVKDHQPEYFTGIEYEVRIGNKDLEEHINLQHTLPSGFYHADYKNYFVDIPSRYTDNYDQWDSKTIEDFNIKIAEVSYKGLQKEIDEFNLETEVSGNSSSQKNQSEKIKVNCKNIECNTILNLNSNSDGVVKCPECGLKFYART